MSPVLFDAFQRVCKWRRVPIAQFFGRKMLGAGQDPAAVKAFKDLVEGNILLRVELSALANVLIKKGVMTLEEYEVQLLTEAHQYHLQMEKKFPGFRASEEGLVLTDQAITTMESWEK